MEQKIKSVENVIIKKKSPTYVQKVFLVSISIVQDNFFEISISISISTGLLL